MQILWLSPIPSSLFVKVSELKRRKSLDVFETQQLHSHNTASFARALYESSSQQDSSGKGPSRGVLWLIMVRRRHLRILLYLNVVVEVFMGVQDILFKYVYDNSCSVMFNNITVTWIIWFIWRLFCFFVWLIPVFSCFNPHKMVKQERWLREEMWNTDESLDAVIERSPR